MIPVNLLPHRAQRRAALQRQFFVLVAMTAGLGLAIVVLVHTYFAGQMDNQRGRNQYLEGEISALDRQIAEIKTLKEQIQAMVERKNVVESLQLNRSEAVRLLDQLVRQIPDGLYLTQVKQTGSRVNVVGYSTSNARVSTFMRNLEASPFLESPTLVVVKEGGGEKQNLSEFTLTVNLTREKSPEAPQGKAQKPKS
ncbi:MAG: PilN domain-containing protein [Betaproteobacteria bacterium]|jgi:type IV pilus assembly protein PilN|nr:PilN domain-containing protein [Rhodocyclaceae bacterium]MCA3449327.1 PilN domain-containing protein [Rhodobacter sp.]MCE2897474.1 PilN domain-containing protein [Betaproteobacteria bacterium]MCA3134047.1 PilN domain-containing protein [Rhodocyclaceae bacterium]MCA3142661.1 PilN domain-containing protein [Rhodocyclaceae bacterium]